MISKPWTDADPQPGDFDACLAKLDPRHVERRDGDRDAMLIILLGVEGEDAKRLERIAEARGQKAAMSSPRCFETQSAPSRSRLTQNSFAGGYGCLASREAETARVLLRRAQHAHAKWVIVAPAVAGVLTNFCQAPRLPAGVKDYRAVVRPGVEVPGASGSKHLGECAVALDRRLCGIYAPTSRRVSW